VHLSTWRVDRIEANIPNQHHRYILGSIVRLRIVQRTSRQCRSSLEPSRSWRVSIRRAVRRRWIQL
jgi:hypothetical protein